MNLALAQVGGVLAVSQFTLRWGTAARATGPAHRRRGPEAADALHEQYVALLRREGLRVETGRFQTHMEVTLVNDGPVTLLLESRNSFRGMGMKSHHCQQGPHGQRQERSSPAALSMLERSVYLDGGLV